MHGLTTCFRRHQNERRGAVMSKNKPKETIEYVIRLQDKERQLLDSITTAYMMGNAGRLMEGAGIPELTKQMKDPTEMIGIFYSIAMLLEFLGIETGLPTPADALPYFQEYQRKSEAMAEKRKEAGGSTSVWGQFLDTMRTAFGVDPSKRWE